MTLPLRGLLKAKSIFILKRYYNWGEEINTMQHLRNASINRIPYLCYVWPKTIYQCLNWLEVWNLGSSGHNKGLWTPINLLFGPHSGSHWQVSIIKYKIFYFQRWVQHWLEIKHNQENPEMLKYNRVQEI